MKLMMEGDPDEIKKLLDAMAGSKEQLVKLSSLYGRLPKSDVEHCKPEHWHTEH